MGCARIGESVAATWLTQALCERPGSMSIECVAALIAAHDRVHTIAFQARIQRQSDLDSELDAFVEALPNDDRVTFQGIGGAWHEIDPAMAAAIVRRVLEFDLAHGTREIDEQDALKIFATFLHLFRPDTRFLPTDYSPNTDGVAGDAWRVRPSRRA